MVEKNGKNSTLRKSGQGSFSLAFFWCLGKKKYILKCPLQKGKLFYKKWRDHVQKEVLFLNQYAPKQKQVVLPEIVEFSDSFFVQKKVEGVPLTADVYQKLSASEQHKIARDLAIFYKKLHQQTRQDFRAKSFRSIVPKKCQDLFDEEEKAVYKKYTALLKKNPVDKTFSCLCVGDLKSTHILYDLSKQKVGLIDFGTIRFNAPETEFILKSPIRSHLSLRMLKDVICQYNILCKAEIVFLIRIKCFLILYAMVEVYSGCAGMKICPREKRRLNSILFDFIANVEQIF